MKPPAYANQGNAVLDVEETTIVYTPITNENIPQINIQTLYISV